jgi:prepilin-type N-terminal cleavage/methylation domain
MQTIQKASPHRRRNRGGFSLVEMLVVTSIIALLAGLVFPVTNKLRDKGKEIQCANNIKQLMTAMMQYVDEHRAIFPEDGSTSSGSGGAASKAWYDVLPPYIAMTPFYELQQKGKVPAPGAGKSTFICPSAPIVGELVAGANAGMQNKYSYSYGMNYWINAPKESKKFTSPMYLSQVEHSELFVVFSETEAHTHKTVALYPSGGGSTPAYRHGKRVNCGFADGHVAAVTAELAKGLQWNPDFEPGQEPDSGGGGN